MKTIFFSVFLLVAFTVLRASWIVYNTTLEEFVASRDVVVKGVVRTVRDIEQQPNDQLAVIEILEVFKNEKKKPEIRAGSMLELIVPTTKGEMRMAGCFYHDPGSKAIWILSSNSKNYGMDSERVVQQLGYEDKIRAGIPQEGERTANQALVPTIVSVTPAADAPVAPATTAAHL